MTSMSRITSRAVSIGLVAMTVAACSASAPPPSVAKGTAAASPTAIVTATPSPTEIMTAAASPTGTAALPLTPAPSGSWVGRFVATGSMTTPRHSHTAVRLADGRVLILGGSSGQADTDAELPNCEVYDPRTGSFAATGTLSHTSYKYRTYLLPNGRVLVADAHDLDFIVDEEYDPATGRFLGVEPFAISGGSAVSALSDGRLLIMGGVTKAPNYSFLATASIYDPATGRSTGTGPMHTPRSGADAILLKDGRVLVMGGFDPSAEVYDPATGTFTETGSMGPLRAFESIVLLQDGRVLLAGGLLGSGWSQNAADAEIYDPGTGRFIPTGSMSLARDTAQATVLADGRVLVLGGALDRAGLAYGDLYDPRTGTFSKTSPLGTTRMLPTATALQNGNVLITGGSGPGDKILSSAELFEP